MISRRLLYLVPLPLILAACGPIGTQFALPGLSHGNVKQDLLVSQEDAEKAAILFLKAAEDAPRQTEVKTIGWTKGNIGFPNYSNESDADPVYVVKVSDSLVNPGIHGGETGNSYTSSGGTVLIHGNSGRILYSFM